jgi:competence protein ComEC
VRYILLIVLSAVVWVRYQSAEHLPVNMGENNPLTGLRLSMQKNLRHWLPGDAGPLASGILLGGNEGLSVKAKTAFRNTNLLHITAASGYNVVIVSAWLSIFGKKIWNRRKAIILSVIGVGVYIFLAGVSAAVVRAGVMAILALIGGYWGKKSDTGWLLILTCLVMLVIQPDWIGDIGFQLSMAATAGLIWVSTPQYLVIADLKSTFAAQIATIPLIAHYFGSFSFISLITNLAVLWTIPLIMQISAVSSVIGLFIPALGGLSILIAWPLLAYLEGMVKWMADWPGANIYIGQPGWMWVVLYYAGIWLIFPPKDNGHPA